MRGVFSTQRHARKITYNKRLMRALISSRAHRWGSHSSLMAFLSRKLIYTRLLLTEIKSWKKIYSDLCSFLTEQQSPTESKPTSLCWILYQRSPAQPHKNKSNHWTADLPFKYKGFTKYISACPLETPTVVGLRQIRQYFASDWSADQSESKLSKNEDQLDSTETFLQRGFFSFG